MTDLITFRDRLYQACPSWLRGWWGSRLLYAIGVQFDALVDWASFAVHVRYPSWCARNMPDALAVHGRSRGIRRGFAESAQSYAARLSLWWPTRRQKGSLYALMDQLAGYMTGYAVPIRCVNLNGAWMTRNTDGTREYHRSTPTNWAWDTLTTSWSRYWVIIYPPSSLWTDEGVFGDEDGYFGDGGQVGSTITQEQADTLRAIISEWNPPHARCEYLILAFDRTFDPAAAAGHPMPTTDWVEWSGRDGSDNCVGTRLVTARYCSGVAS